MHIKMMEPHLFKNVSQYPMAKFNNAKPQLLLHQPNRLEGRAHSSVSLYHAADVMPSAVVLTSFLLLTCDLICSSFSSFLRWELRLLILDLFLLMYAFTAITFPPSTVLAASHRFG